MIASLQNNKVRYVQALQSRRRIRQREQRLVFEGIRLVEEAVRARAALDYVLYTDDLLSAERGTDLLAALASVGARCYAVTDSIMRAISDTQSPQGIVAVLQAPNPPPPTDPTVTLVVDGVRDPGNLGTTLRTALAASVDQVILAPGTVDPSNPKVVRAAMGAHLHLPIVALRWPEIPSAIGDAQVWLAAAAGGVAYTEVDWTGPVALIIGGEGAGAGSQAQVLAQGQVSVPMAADVESLNTAIAASVVLYEIRRQRSPAAG